MKLISVGFRVTPAMYDKIQEITYWKRMSTQELFTKALLKEVEKYEADKLLEASPSELEKRGWK